MNFYTQGQKFVTNKLFSEDSLLKKIFKVREKVQNGEVKSPGLVGNISQRHQALKDAMGS